MDFSAPGYASTARFTLGTNIRDTAKAFLSVVSVSVRVERTAKGHQTIIAFELVIQDETATTAARERTRSKSCTTCSRQRKSRLSHSFERKHAMERPKHT